MFPIGRLVRRCSSSLDALPKIVVSTQGHTFAYNGRASLLDLLARQEAAFFDLLEEAARHGWLTAQRVQDIDVALSHLVIKHDVPQA